MFLFFDNNIFFPSILIFIVWFITFIALLLIRYVFKESEEVLTVMNDKCIDPKPKYQYLIYMSFKSLKFPSKSIFSFELYDRNKRFLTRLISPPDMIRNHSYPISLDMKAMRYLVDRKHPLVNLGYVRICHNSYISRIRIISFEIEEMTKKGNSFNANVCQEIRPIILNKHKLDYQRFQLIDIGSNSQIQKTILSSTIEWQEYIAFVFFLFNAIPFFCLFFVFCSGFKICHNFSDSLVSKISDAIVSNIISILLTIGLIYIYKKFIKQYYFESLASNFWLIIRIIYLSFVVSIGVMFGIAVGFHCLIKKCQKTNDWIENYMESATIAYLIAFFITIPSSVFILYLNNFFKKPKFVTNVSQKSTTNQSKKTKSKSQFFDSDIDGKSPPKIRIKKNSPINITSSSEGKS